MKFYHNTIIPLSEAIKKVMSTEKRTLNWKFHNWSLGLVMPFSHCVIEEIHLNSLVLNFLICKKKGLNRELCKYLQIICNSI